MIYVVWGRKPEGEEWAETVLSESTDPKWVKEVVKRASADGWIGIRIVEYRKELTGEEIANMFRNSVRI